MSKGVRLIHSWFDKLTTNGLTFICPALSNSMLGGDTLLIYKIDDHHVHLTRLGSHAQLFKNN
ncbi:hypothetical protein CRENPOLYSF2_3390008 [Crenothrix polyspora]|uniref:Type II toxin-antitoxin system mRNA interferase toxin, RelE/StbE family n=1 Tax=Crenothrix polyspora TaxID=360316 RepID=A0A1R4HBX5_9GAMM|nr:hypothetical protein CRENPOLYSF2_3390008 [Crenothrix polyspora]